MELTVISPPGEAALSLASAKAFLRIGHDGEDSLVLNLVQSAETALETATGLCLVARGLRLSWNVWPGGLLRLGVLTLRPGPVQAVETCRLRSPGDDDIDLSGRFDLHDGRLCLKAGACLPSIPAGGRFEVDIVTGFGGASDVPGDVRLALQTIVQAAYGERPARQPELAEEIAASRREVRI